MTATRRLLLASPAILAMPARAQGFPDRPIRINVPYPPGGGSDAVLRGLTESMRETLGQPIVIDNKPGAGGNLGAEQVARAPKDGYTLLFTAGALAIAPSVNRALSFDPRKDLAGVALAAYVPLILVVAPNSPIRSVADIIALARQRQDGVTYGSFGIATPPHLVGERINQHAGLSMTHVPYRGSSTALPDLLDGRLTFGIFDAVSMTPQVTSGRLRALAITGPRRSEALPDLPTLTEAGVPFDTVGWHAAFAPAGTPAPIIARLNAAFVKALEEPRAKRMILGGGSMPIEPPLSPAEWDAHFARDVESWGAIARAAHITLD
ncbi:tripartite tricarboxylate transporter substrate binding protein [Rhodovarius crocodyli]|uniref:Tripartite tricarboxylate transporter substrate binding protein n=1 Tax=Rhodovarius crocodyli TaxID=1979269 RepID=A0A437MDB0_9PROT|nr:tripartite tricarboxylate transporter substrate binding protein [Rhodovarius crocodyli]RVT95563.1 tripartite tricarboxylate transporter substrate binding protein [Rhodovarius crocodyli]